MFFNQNITDYSGVRSGDIGELNSHSLSSDFNHSGLEFYPCNTHLKSCDGFFSPVSVFRLYIWQRRTALNRIPCPSCIFASTVSGTGSLLSTPFGSAILVSFFNVQLHLYIPHARVTDTGRCKHTARVLGHSETFFTFPTKVSLPGIFPTGKNGIILEATIVFCYIHNDELHQFCW